MENESLLLFIGVAILLISAFSSTAKGQDWNQYQEWENTTEYSRTYVVDQKHPHASDTGEGSFNHPFKTINKAASVVRAGERVLVYGGIYREMIEPVHGGRSDSEMITYEVYPGEEVIVKGSRIFNGEWIQRRVKTDILPDENLPYTWSTRVWIAEIPDSLFEGGYNPFLLENITSDEHKLMPWARLVTDKVPFTSKRGMIFQGGKRLIQLENVGDVAKIPGSFWVEPDGKKIHLHAFGSVNPNREFFEIAVQSHLLKPTSIGLGYIQIKGFTFEHAANGFLRTSTGAVTTLGGHHWIIEDNIIRQVNSSALEFGYYAYEFEDQREENIQPRKDPDLGGVIIRNNSIYEAGTAGIRSYSVKNGIISGNRIWNIGWQDAQNYWECAGIKILRAHNTLVSENEIFNVVGGNGIWMDWDIRESRVTRNLIYNIKTIQGGIFVEASQVSNLVDNNIIWGVDGSGLYLNDSDKTLAVHNLVGEISGPPVTAIVATKRKLGGRWLTATENKIYNNIFVDVNQAILMDRDANDADYNLYVSTDYSSSFLLESVQAKGFELNSEQRYASFGFDSKYGIVSFSDLGVLDFPGFAIALKDYFHQERSPGKVQPGPFIELDGERILLKEPGLR